jgi:hypothetical protein
MPSSLERIATRQCTPDKRRCLWRISHVSKTGASLLNAASAISWSASKEKESIFSQLSLAAIGSSAPIARSNTGLVVALPRGL